VYLKQKKDAELAEQKKKLHDSRTRLAERAAMFEKGAE
jgi:hypothetical protein